MSKLSSHRAGWELELDRRLTEAEVEVEQAAAWQPITTPEQASNAEFERLWAADPDPARVEEYSSRADEQAQLCRDWLAEAGQDVATPVVGQALASRQDGESVADALARIAAADAQLADDAALAQRHADAMAALAESAAQIAEIEAEWAAHAADPERIARWAEIDADVEAQLAEFQALAAELREVYGPDAEAMADGLLDGLLTYAAEWDAAPGVPVACPPPWLVQVRELAARGPAEMTRRFGSIFLGDGSQWEAHDDGRLTLTFPPYRYPRLAAVLSGTASEIIDQVAGY